MFWYALYQLCFNDVYQIYKPSVTKKIMFTCTIYLLMMCIRCVLTMCTMVTHRVVFPVVFLMYTAIGTLVLGESIQTLLKTWSDSWTRNGHILHVGSWKMLVLYKENIRDMLMYFVYSSHFHHRKCHWANGSLLWLLRRGHGCSKSNVILPNRRYTYTYIYIHTYIMKSTEQPISNSALCRKTEPNAIPKGNGTRSYSSPPSPASHLDFGPCTPVHPCLSLLHESLSSLSSLS